jgi:cytochrome c biogenesis protein CcmG, thiol:disulfide interchange protein DsbE
LLFAKKASLSSAEYQVNERNFVRKPVIAAVVITVAVSLFAMEDSTSIVGQAAPSFRLLNQNGTGSGQFNLNDQFLPDSQHAVIISFFATWCAPCRKELPFLQKAADSLHQSGLRLVAICIDSVFGDKARKMVTDLRLKCPVVSTTTGILAKRYGVSHELPQTFFIDRKGVVQAKTVGFGKKEIAACRQGIKTIVAR